MHTLKLGKMTEDYPNGNNTVTCPWLCFHKCSIDSRSRCFALDTMLDPFFFPYLCWLFRLTLKWQHPHLLLLQLEVEWGVDLHSHIYLMFSKFLKLWCLQKVPFWITSLLWFSLQPAKELEHLMLTPCFHGLLTCPLPFLFHWHKRMA